MKLISTLLFLGSSGLGLADEPAALKDAFKDHFLVGTAVSRSIVTVLPEPV